jgi:hypothetical protein
LRYSPHRHLRFTPLLIAALVCSPVLAQQSILTIYRTAADAEPYRKPIATIVDNRLTKLKSDDPADPANGSAIRSPQPESQPQLFGCVRRCGQQRHDNALHAQPATAPATSCAVAAIRLNLAIVNATVAARVDNARQAFRHGRFSSRSQFGRRALGHEGGEI